MKLKESLPASPTRRISGEKRIGTKILKSESLAWNLTLRKTRRDARKRE